MTAAEERFQRIEAEFRERFKRHRATLWGGLKAHVSHITWKRPATLVDHVEFTIIHRSLAVTGDLGDAIYEWSGPVNWRRLAGHDFSYFTSKCKAWSVDSDPCVWDRDVARARLVSMATGEDTDRATEALGALGDIHGHIQWLGWLHGTYGVDAIEDFGDVGLVAHPRAIAHWVGLTMAVSQIGV